MAARYWVGGTATWDATAGSKWSTTSGGAGGSAIPTSADDVFFDASSTGTVTMSSSTVARSINCTGFTGTLSHPAALTINIGDSTAGDGNIAFKTVASMTYTVGNATTSIINLVSTSATQQDLTFGGKTWPTLVINATGGSYRATDAMVLSSGGLTLTAGGFTTNNQTCTWVTFNSANSNTRSLSLGSSAISLTGSWNLSTTTNLTFNAGTSTITVVAGNATFNGGGLTYYNLSIGGNGGGHVLAGTNTFNNLTFTGTNNGRLSISADQVVNGQISSASSGTTNMSLVQSSVRGVARTITAASVGSLINHNFQDIAAAGASIPWSTTNVGDLGGNSNITFASPVTRYWVGNGGSWNSTAKWSTSSGGSSGASIPLCHDVAVFDANSITSASQTITINQQCCPTIDFRNVLNSPTIAQTITNGVIFIKGGLYYASGQTTSGTTFLNFVGRGTSDQLQTNGITLTNNIEVQCVSGTLTLNSDYTSSASITLTYGTFSAGGFNLTATTFSSSNTNTRTITMGAGTWTLTGTGTVWNISNATNLTVSQGTSTIVISDTSATSKTFNGGGKVYNNFTVTGGGTGAILWGNNSNTFNIFTINGPKTLTLQSTATQTVSSLVLNSSVGNVITINSNTNGAQATISMATGVVEADYLSLKDIKVTGANSAFYAGLNSTNTSGNTGWIFSTSAIARSAGQMFNLFF